MRDSNTESSRSGVVKKGKRFNKNRRLGKNANRFLKRVFAAVCLLILAAVLNSCSADKTDLRTLVSADSIAYFETNDLGKVFSIIVQNEAIGRNTSESFDGSQLNGIRAAVAVSDLDTSESRLSEESSVLSLKPVFVVVAETNVWNWQLTPLVENGLNSFVREAYGDGIKLDREIRNKTDWYVWSAAEGKKAYAVIAGTQIFFSNDEELIAKSLAAKRGEIGALSTNEEFNAALSQIKKSLAFGYVSKIGTRRLADVVGVSAAMNRAKEASSRGAISRIISQLMTNAVEGIEWSADGIEKGIQDRVLIKTSSDLAAVAKETIKPASDTDGKIFELIPPDFKTLTRYNLQNPRVAFRSAVLATAKNISTSDGKLIAAFSNSLLEPYGVSKAEEFLNGIEPEIVTAQLDERGERTFAIVKVRNLKEIGKSVLVDFVKTPEEVGDARWWKTESPDVSAALIENHLILGSERAIDSVLASITKRKVSPIPAEKDLTKSRLFGLVRNSKSPAATFQRQTEITGAVSRVLGYSEAKPEAKTYGITKTRFTSEGIERTYISDFGFLGSAIAYFDEN